MATGNPGRPNVPGPPPVNSPFAAAAPPTTSPFLSSGPVAGRPDGPGVRPPPPSAPSNAVPFASPGPMAGPPVPGFRPPPPVGFTDQTRPAPPGSPPSHAPSTLNQQQFSAPQYPGPPTNPPIRSPPVGPPNMAAPMVPNMPPPIQRPGVPAPTPPLTFRPNSQARPVQMTPPPQPYAQAPSQPYGQAPPQPYGQAPPQPYGQAPPQPYGQAPPSASPPQPYAQAPPLSSPAHFAQQPAFGQPPSQPGMPMQQHFSAPPTSTMQGLVEDFNSLSLGTVPGSMDPGLDVKALPRPLEGDVEPTVYSEMTLNCSPKYMRLTTSAIPNSHSLASRWHLPLGAVVSPLAEASEGEEVPILNFGSAGIIRCRRCRTYVNPYVTFTDGGRKWRCNMCALLNDVPGDYVAPLDATGRRVDADQRPELIRGSVEFVAPTEYMVRAPMPPLYFFLIDVSVSAVRSGMLEVVAQTIKSCLDELPGSPRTQIGFITFDSTIHFYNMKSTLTQPQMMVVSDVDDIFVPLPDDLLVNLSESRNVVESFLDSLPSMFQDTMNVESAFGPALKAAYMVMNQLGGKLLIFQNTLPSIGVGRLRLRGDDPRVYGTDKEASLRVPEDPFYKQMAADCTKYQIGVNVYAFSDKYTDIASLGTLSKYTGGQVYYYPNFKSTVHGDKLRHELARDLTRETAWEAVMRIRCGKGVKFNSYHGNFMLRSTDLIALPAVDCDKAFAMQLGLEETLLTTQTVYFQVALLYTASCGERRIRVHTAAAPVVADLGEMYRRADTGAIVSVLGRLAIEKTLSSKLEDARLTSNFISLSQILYSGLNPVLFFLLFIIATTITFSDQMAGMCCGINVGENEPTSPVEPASRTARRRRMELRQIKFITDIADTTRFKRRKIEDHDQQPQQQQPTLILPAARECEKFLTLKFPGEKPKESTLDDDFPKFGYTSVCGRRRDMEDAVTIRPSFCKKDDSKNQPGFHFYGVYDGHGCSHVAKRCKERMHAIVKEEIEKNEDDDWTQALSQSFTRMDKEVGDRAKNNAGASTSTSCRCELQTPQCDAVGSTAVVSVVTPEKIVVSNCGDSRAVLCRKGVAIPLSNDHKPDRPDELTRIEEAGGRVIYWDGARVLGMLAMSRAIGDNYLKPYVIPDPEVTVTDRTSDDECLILASDGLWDVVSNETAAAVARMCLINAEKPASPPRSPRNEAVVAATKDSSDKACSDASILLTKLALARQSADNVSVVVVDLRK